MMRKNLKRFLALGCMAIAAMGVSAGTYLLGGAVAEGGATSKYKLEFSSDLQAKTAGISYDVSFTYDMPGWMANAIPTTENITMKWTGISETSTPRPNGEFHGFARSATATDLYYVFNSVEGYGAVGYNGAYNWEGCSDTFTKSGTTTTITYSKEHIAKQKELWDQGAGYYTPQVLVNGTYMDLAEYPSAPNGFKAADDAGAKYFALQWIMYGGEYSVSLTDVQIYNESGYDLGIQFAKGTPSAGTEKVTYSAQRYAVGGTTLTVNPDEKTGYKFAGLNAVSASGVSALALTDNGDGTYSFTMPEEDVSIEAKYRKEANQKLDIVGGTTAKINGVSYEADFVYNLDGWFANSVPTMENITMSWTSVSQANALRAVGEIYGVARAKTATNQHCMFFSDETGVMGYNGAYNGGSETFTKPGTQTTLVYDKQRIIDQRVALDQDPMGYHPPQILMNGAYFDLAEYPYAPSKFKESDEAGAQHLAVQWTGEKLYSASLTDLQIYNQSGDDLGIMFSATGLSSVERYATAGATITVKPDEKAGYMFTGWTATDANGAYELAITDNGDGTYSFTMPEQALTLTANYSAGEVKYMSISTAGDIGLNFYVQLPNASIDTVTATLSMEGKADRTATGVYSAGRNCFVFSYGVAPKDYKKDVTITLEGAETITGTTSVEKYAAKVPSTDKAYPLVQKLMTYCEAARAYFDDSVTVTDKTALENGTDLSGYKGELTNVHDDVTVLGATLVIESKTAIHVYFTTEKALSDITVTCEKSAVKVEAVAGVENLYVAKIDNIAVKDLDETYTVEIGEDTIKYSAISYVQSVLSQNDVDAELNNVVVAIYGCCVEANEYFKEA